MGLAFSLWDAFAEAPFGGSQAAVVEDAAGIDRETRIRLAKELGYPATAFVDAVTPGRVQAQFFSTVMEQPMCGHGTLCLISQLVATGQLPGTGSIELALPAGTARVDVRPREDGRTLVMLEVRPPYFRRAPADLDGLMDLLGLDRSALSTDLPPEIAASDFVHLALPMRDLSALGQIAPDFAGLAAYCRAQGVETVAAFSLETQDPTATLQVRDFCPAVGVPESAAAGTTNAALASYLLRHGKVADVEGRASVVAEQGIGLGRPARIQTELILDEDELRLATGGVATRLISGTLDLA